MASGVQDVHEGRVRHDRCARARPVHSDVKFSFEDVEGISSNTYGRFIRGPVDKESRVWRDAPADSSIPGPFWSTRRMVTFEPPGGACEQGQPARGDRCAAQRLEA